MKRQKGRPKALKPTIRGLIIERAIEKRRMPREFLAQELIKEIEERGEIAPTEETLKSYISKARSKELAYIDDTEWSIGACAEYYDRISPESILILLKIKQFIGLQKFTIRKAIWVSRLYSLILDFYNNDEEELKNVLYAWSDSYAWEERISELTNSKFETSELDQGLLNFLLKDANKEKESEI